MNSILWYQTDENHIENVISFNGEIIPPKTTQFDNLYKVLYEINKKLNTNKPYNTQIGLYKLPTGGFFIKNYFEEKDFYNRKLAFMYYCDTDNVDEFINNFKKEALICQKTYSDFLIENMKKRDNIFFSGQKMIISIVIIIFIIVTTFLVIHANNHQSNTDINTNNSTLK